MSDKPELTNPGAPDRHAHRRALAALSDLANDLERQHKPEHYARILTEYVEQLEADLAAERQERQADLARMRAEIEVSDHNFEQVDKECVALRAELTFVIAQRERLEVLHSAMAGVLQAKPEGAAGEIIVPPDAPLTGSEVAALAAAGGRVAQRYVFTTKHEPPDAPRPRMRSDAWDRALHADGREHNPVRESQRAQWLANVAQHDRAFAAERERGAVLSFLQREATRAEENANQHLGMVQADCVRSLWLAISAGEHLDKRDLEPGERA